MEKLTIFFNLNKYLKFIVNRSKHIFCSHYVFLKCMRPLNTTIVTTNVTFYDEHTLLLNDSMFSENKAARLSLNYSFTFNRETMLRG